jgi:hypothetical protein
MHGSGKKTINRAILRVDKAGYAGERYAREAAGLQPSKPVRGNNAEDSASRG